MPSWRGRLTLEDRPPRPGRTESLTHLTCTRYVCPSDPLDPKTVSRLVGGGMGSRVLGRVVVVPVVRYSGRDWTRG